MGWRVGRFVGLLRVGLVVGSFTGFSTIVGVGSSVEGLSEGAAVDTTYSLSIRKVESASIKSSLASSMLSLRFDITFSSSSGTLERISKVIVDDCVVFCRERSRLEIGVWQGSH